MGRRHSGPGRSGSVSQLGGRVEGKMIHPSKVLPLSSCVVMGFLSVSDLGQVRASASSLESERLEPDDAQAFPTRAACGAALTC